MFLHARLLGVCVCYSMCAHASTLAHHAAPHAATACEHKGVEAVSYWQTGSSVPSWHSTVDDTREDLLLSLHHSVISSLNYVCTSEIYSMTAHITAIVRKRDGPCSCARA